MQYLKRFWPYFALLGLVLVISFLNYHPGTILTGGDNLHPEYNFASNIKRSLFAVWQEYQGLGLLGGMGHATDLLRQLFLLFLSLFFPTEILRYIWTFLTLFIGACGAYKLILFLIKSVTSRESEVETNELPKTTNRLNPTTSILAFLGASYYLLNLSTVQSYYTPFEVFTAHFAALPWLLWSGVRLLTNKTRSNLLLFTLILILATPAAYVPTLFVVFLMALGVFTLLIFLLESKTRKKAFSFTASKMFLIIFLVNSFWLLPFSYFTLTKSTVNVNAKINQMATETIFLLNKESGNVTDAMLLKGFWFNNVEPNFQGINVYMLEDWRRHIGNPFIRVVGFFIFGIIFIGLLSSLRKKKSYVFPFAVVGIIAFCMLVTATPPFSWINIFTREYLPLFSQVFRFPFTKFSILTSLIYAIFFTVGIRFLLLQAAKTIGQSSLRILIYALPLILCIVFVLPIFTGHLFYDNERLLVPKTYQSLFQFFDEQDKNERIAVLPVNSFWDWKFYSWGYRGSGFLWYGINQPILDRAFDVFSKENENYYHEVSQAVYSKNETALLSVLQKYQIRWLILDKSIIFPASPKSLFHPELISLLEDNQSVVKTKEFGHLSVYKVSLTDNPKSFVFTTPRLPGVNPYSWIETDKAYMDLGNYKTVGSKDLNLNDRFYPFRSLFSLKTQPELEYDFIENDTNLLLTSSENLPTTLKTLTVPSFLDTENSIPGKLVVAKQGTTYALILEFILPDIWVGDKKVYGEMLTKPLFPLPSKKPGESRQLRLNLNGTADYTIPLEEGPVGMAYLPLHQTSFFTLSDITGKTNTQLAIPESYFQEQKILTEEKLIAVSPGQLSVSIPKVNHPSFSFVPFLSSNITVRNCDRFRQGTFEAELNESRLHLSSQNATACIAYYTKELLHAESYALFIKAQNLTGRSLHTWILNEDEKYAPLETYLPAKKGVTTSFFILPPQEPYGKAYSIHFDNSSIGKQTSANDIHKVSMYPIPHAFLTSLMTSGRPSSNTPPQQPDFEVSHPNEGLYYVNFKPGTREAEQTLVLSQGFDPGWQAFQVKSSSFKVRSFFVEKLPFIFGKRLEHIKINNWENGWVINHQLSTINHQQIVIIYLPQYLEYLGFALLIGTVGFLVITSLRNKH